MWLNHVMDDRHFIQITELRGEKENPASSNYSLDLVFVFSIFFSNKKLFSYFLLKNKTAPPKRKLWTRIVFYFIFFRIEILTKFMKEN
jgi:hypothetical protein